MRRTAELASSALWKTPTEGLTAAKRTRLSYERSKSVVDLYSK